MYMCIDKTKYNLIGYGIFTELERKKDINNTNPINITRAKLSNKEL